MSKVLSQEEIDSLLQSVKSGTLQTMPSEDESKRCVNYDFRRALHFSKDHFRIIHRIFDQFARQFSNHLGTRLRAVTMLQVESVDELPYEEFISSIPRLTVLQLMGLEPLKGNIAIEFNMQMVYAMLDFFMGGVGQRKYEERELTEIEDKLFHNIINDMRHILADALSTFVQVIPVFHSIESNPQFVQIASPNESVLLVTLNMKLGDLSGLVNICIPYITIEEIVPKLTSRSYYTANNSHSEVLSEQYHTHLDYHIKQSVVETSVTLGEATLEVKDVLDLQIGDIIALNQSIHDSLVFLADGAPVLVGNIGISGNHYALKIVDKWKDGNYVD